MPAVRQNRQPIAQPAWEETHRVWRPLAGINTLSMTAPSSSRKANLTVPSSRPLHLRGFEPADEGVFGEQAADLFLDGLHPGKVTGAGPVHECENVSNPRSGQAHAREELRQLRLGEVFQVGRHRQSPG